MNSLFLNALKCQNSSRPPIWLMRQAGRYMAAYRGLRQKYSFLEMCHNPDLISEVTLLPIKTFGFDAAILFSDILMIPEAMQFSLYFKDNYGPVIDNPVQSTQDIDDIAEPDMSYLGFVREGIIQTCSQLDVPLIGFCGAPFTVASYLIEGASSRDLKLTKQWMFSNPVAFHQLLSKITDWSIAYLNMQIEAGVQAIQIFDSWANVLAHPQFMEFSLFYLDSILKGIKNHHTPVIVFSKGASVFAQELVKIEPACLSLDWNCDITTIRNIIPNHIAIQGNLDPNILLASTAVIEKEVNRILDGLADDTGFVFNLGHGILPDTPESAVKTLVECVKKRTYEYALP